MIKSLNRILLLTFVIAGYSVTAQESTHSSYHSIAFDKLEVDLNSGQIFETKGYSFRAPTDWTRDLMGPFTDSLGRTHSNANIFPTSYIDNSANVTIYRLGYEIEIEEEITALINEIKEDEDVTAVNKIVDENGSFGSITCKKIIIIYEYEDIDSKYIRTAYFYNKPNNSFIIEIDYALEDESKYETALALINQTFQFIPY